MKLDVDSMHNPRQKSLLNLALGPSSFHGRGVAEKYTFTARKKKGRKNHMYRFTHIVVAASKQFYRILLELLLLKNKLQHKMYKAKTTLQSGVPFSEQVKGTPNPFAN